MAAFLMTILRKFLELKKATGTALVYVENFMHGL